MSLDIEAAIPDELAHAAERGTTDAGTSTSRPTIVRYIVLGWLCAVAAIAYIDRGCLSVAEGLIRSDLGLSEWQMGQLMSAFLVTYAIFQVPAAWVDQRFGTRKALTFFAAAWSLSTALCGVATGMGMLLIGRLAMGAAEAGCLPSSTAAIRRWFPPAWRATASGILTSFMGIGGVIGAALSGVILNFQSWRWMFAIYTIPGLIWAAGFLFWYRNTPSEHTSVNQAEADLIRAGEAPSPAKAIAPLAWGTLLRDRALLGLCLQQCFRASGAMFYLTWFPTYLRETRGVEILEMGVLASMPHGAITAGCLAGGWISDSVLRRTGSMRMARQGVSSITLALATLCILLAFPVSNAWLAVLVLSVGAFAASISGPCAYALTIDLGKANTAQYFGIMNTAGTLGAIVFPLLAPWLVKATGSWNAVMLLFAGLHLIACLCWLIFDADDQIRRNEAGSPSIAHQN